MRRFIGLVLSSQPSPACQRGWRCWPCVSSAGTAWDAHTQQGMPGAAALGLLQSKELPQPLWCRAVQVLHQPWGWGEIANGQHEDSTSAHGGWDTQGWQHRTSQNTTRCWQCWPLNLKLTLHFCKCTTAPKVGMQTLTQHGGEHRDQNSPPTGSTSAFEQEFLSCYRALSKAGCGGMSVCSTFLTWAEPSLGEAEKTERSKRISALQQQPNKGREGERVCALVKHHSPGLRSLNSLCWDG